jgi:hypothetical protein
MCPKSETVNRSEDSLQTKVFDEMPARKYF